MQAALAPGTLLGATYRVQRLIGRGGMGEVYEAAHSRLSGRYAIKVLSAAAGEAEHILLRFRREAEVTSGLRHPNIVNVIDYNTTSDGRPYLVMEYLDGRELTAEIQRSAPMPVARVLDLVGQIASALTAAHTHNIVHRDLKPQNLFLVPVAGEEREIVKVVDFGISKVREATTQLTEDTAIMGTPQYMAPEQAQGRLTEIDQRTDQFALAAIAYEMLTGRSAFRGGTVPALLYQVVHEQPEPLRAFNPEVTPALEAVIFRALAKRRDDRFPSVRDFATELARAGADTRRIALPPTVQLQAAVPRWIEQPQPPPATTFGTASGLVASRRTTGGKGARNVALAAMIPLLLAAGYFWYRSQPARPVAAIEEPPPPVLAPPATVRIELVDAPPGLRVRLDGAPATSPLELPRGRARYQLELEAPGHRPMTLQLSGEQSRALSLAAMQKEEAPATPAIRPAAPAVASSRRAAERRTRKVERAASPPATKPAPAAAPDSAAKRRLIMDL